MKKSKKLTIQSRFLVIKQKKINNNRYFVRNTVYNSKFFIRSIVSRSGSNYVAHSPFFLFFTIDNEFKYSYIYVLSCNLAIELLERRFRFSDDSYKQLSFTIFFLILNR